MTKKKLTVQKKPRLNTWFNRDVSHRYEKVNDTISLTQPNDAYTIKQLFERFSQGIPLPTPQDEYYDSDVDHDIISIDEFNKLDPAEQLQFIEYHSEILEEYKDGLKKQNKDAEEAEHKNEGEAHEKDESAIKPSKEPK